MDIKNLPFLFLASESSNIDLSNNELKASTKDTVSESKFDLDFEISELEVMPPTTQFWTSQSLCTPGCTNGTGNSFCCTCK